MEKNEVQKKGFFDKAMDFIEKIGNAMPDPVSLFIILEGRPKRKQFFTFFWGFFRLFQRLAPKVSAG